MAVMAPMVETTEEAEWFAKRVEATGGRDAGGWLRFPPRCSLPTILRRGSISCPSGQTTSLSISMRPNRQEGSLAELQEPLSPALLRTVREICERAGGRAWMGACDEAAGDPAWALVAVGLGVTELSMGVGVLGVRVALRENTFAQCKRAALAAARETDQASARAAAVEVLTL